MNVFHKSIFVLSILTLILATVAQVLAGPMMMRHGRGPGMHHHSMGFGGKGICPQQRVTAQASEDIYQLKNPLEPTQKNLEKGRGYRICQATNRPDRGNI